MNQILRARPNHHLIDGTRHLLFFALLLFIGQAQFSAQQPQLADPTRLTVDSIFTYRTRSLGPVQWQQDGTGYLALEPSPSKKGFLDIVRYDALSGDRTIKLSAEKLTPSSAAEPLLVEYFDLSANGQKLLVFTKSERVWRSNTRGDYWVVDLNDGSLRKLGGAAAKPSTLMFAKFSPDATSAGYVRENNIYVENLTGSSIKQITRDGSRYLVNGTFDWVYEEELFCRDGFRWSPDGKNIAYWQLNTEGVKEFQLINNTAGLYPVITSFPYPKAGETNSAARVGVVRASGGATRWFDIAGDPRNNYLPRMEWAASSDEVVIQQLNRLQNTNIVMLGDIRSGKVRPVLTEKDETWVDVGWGDLDWDKTGVARGDVEWIDGGKRFLWTSERDGWRHIYSVSRDGSDVKNITPGDYDVMGVEKVDAANGWLYFRASPENAGQRYLYRTRLSGDGKAERLTSEPGTHAYNISPRGDLAIHFFSTFNSVPKSEIVRLPDHTVARTLIDNAALQERIEKLKRGPQEFFRVAIGEGSERLEIDGWVIKPPNFDPQKRYPVLFYVYGEPWGQTVLDAWGGRNQLWHTMLAQQGYVVMSVDSRGTPAPRGRAWRKVIYRQVGIVNSQDHANAVRAIAKWPYVDPARIGIWGWSGGGSSTLNAMFRYPEVYKVGMSVAPVPDLRYYDTIYQERYGGLPQDHPEEWKQSSPITFAEQLKGRLLVVHGTGDDNVHYQGTEALIDKLIAANKQFSVMPYPNRSHGISEGPGTTRHLFGLLTSYLNEELPSGGR